MAKEERPLPEEEQIAAPDGSGRVPPRGKANSVDQPARDVPPPPERQLSAQAFNERPSSSLAADQQRMGELSKDVYDQTEGYGGLLLHAIWPPLAKAVYPWLATQLMEHFVVVLLSIAW